MNQTRGGAADPMTILLCTEDPQQGQALSDQVNAWDGGHLCLPVSPAEAADALREVRADRVVCPAGLTEGLRAAAPVKSPPRFFPWPEQVTEAWLAELTREQ